MERAQPRRRSWTRFGRWGLLAALVLLVAGNGIAWQQAWAMTHYVTGGGRIPRSPARGMR